MAVCRYRSRQQRVIRSNDIYNDFQMPRRFSLTILGGDGTCSIAHLRQDGGVFMVKKELVCGSQLRKLSRW